MKKHVLPFLLLVSVLFTACNKTPNKVISVNPYELTVADQIKIGEAFKIALEANANKFPILNRADYPAANEYVSTLFNTMLNTSQVQRRRDYNWSVHIVKNDELRTAFFLPGGHFYVYTGLLKYLDSESELLGIIGHELYYVDADVLVERMRQAFGGVLLGDILLGNPVPELPSYAAQMPLLDFEEEKVTAADAFAIQLICPFLYEPSGIKKILEKSENQELKPLWLETRPASLEARLLALGAASEACGLPGVSNEENYQKFKLEYLP